MPFFPIRWFALLLLACLVIPSADLQAATRRKSNQSKALAAKSARKGKAVAFASRNRTVRTSRASTRVTRVSARRGRNGRVRLVRAAVYNPFASAAGGPWLAPTFAQDSTFGDRIDGEDLQVRRAAVDALGPYNGTVVVADAMTGRVLTMVNQKLALGNGYQPCSTVKIVAALAGLSEGLVDRNTMLRLYGRTSMNLTNALAHSNNNYFANIGVKLGYDRVNYYARLLGLGERAGLNIPGEEPGTLPDGPPRNGGMAMMTSFGEGIQLTPLQLTALLTAVANGGTLYYLQHPQSPADAENFVPRVKRQLTIQQTLPELIPGLMGAVEYGTARRAYYDPNEPIFGKTGTCTDRATPTHLGWFGSFNQVGDKKLVVTVLLTGGRGVSGPVASGIAGNVYRNLSQARFFNRESKPISPVALISGSWD
jgi:penicillin-binding protein 2